MRLGLPLALAVAVLVLSACGGGGGDGASTRPVSGAGAVAQATTLVEKLDRSLATYREGDRDGAAQQFDAARREHYEPIRAALRRADPALLARLDAALRRSLPGLIDRGVTVTQLARPLAGAEADIGRAAGKLRGT